MIARLKKKNIYIYISIFSSLPPLSLCLYLCLSFSLTLSLYVSTSVCLSFPSHLPLCLDYVQVRSLNVSTGINKSSWTGRTTTDQQGRLSQGCRSACRTRWTSGRARRRAHTTGRWYPGTWDSPQPSGSRCCQL